MKILVAYDGTLKSKEALLYGLEKARKTNGEVIVQHVFNVGMFYDYDAIPNAEAIARSESARFVDEARTIIREKGKGVKATIVTGDGDPGEEAMALAKAEGVDVLLCPPRFRSVIKRYKRALSRSGRPIEHSEVYDDSEQLKLAELSVKSDAGSV